MIRRFSPLVITIQLILDLFLTLLAVKVAEQLRLHIVTGFERREQFVAVQLDVYVLILVIWPICFYMLGVFDPRRRQSLLADIGNLWLAVTVAMLVLASLFYLLALEPPQAPSRLFYMYFFATELLFVTAAHIGVYRIVTSLRRRGHHVRRVLLVGGGLHGRHVAVRLRGRQDTGASLIGYLSDPGDAPIADVDRLGEPAGILAVVERYAIDEVVIALPAEAGVEAADGVEESVGAGRRRQVLAGDGQGRPRGPGVGGRVVDLHRVEGGAGQVRLGEVGAGQVRPAEVGAGASGDA